MILHFKRYTPIITFNRFKESDVSRDINRCIALFTIHISKYKNMTKISLNTFVFVELPYVYENVTNHKKNKILVYVIGV